MSRPISRQAAERLDKLAGLGDDEADALVTALAESMPLPAGVKASFYVSPKDGKAFVVVMNVSEQDQTLRLQLNAKDMGLTDEFRTCLPLYPELPIAFDGRQITDLKVPRNNFRLFLLILTKSSRTRKSTLISITESTTCWSFWLPWGGLFFSYGPLALVSYLQYNNAASISPFSVLWYFCCIRHPKRARKISENPASFWTVSPCCWLSHHSFICCTFSTIL